MLPTSQEKKKSDASFCKEDREGIPGFDKISVEMFQR